MKPLFLEQTKSVKNVELVEGENIFSKDVKNTDIFNTFFSNPVKNLKVSWKSETLITSYELRVQIHELQFKSTSCEFKFMSEFKSTGYEFKSTSYEVKSMSQKTKSMSCKIKNTS